jgi:hypothetical protein
VILSSPSDVARAYPDLVPSAGAAREALARKAKAVGRQQGDFGHFPLWKSYIGESVRNTGAWVRVQYRPAGRGQQTRTAWALADRLPQLRAWLTAAAGAELVHFTPPPAALPPDQAEPEGDPMLPAPHDLPEQEGLPRSNFNLRRILPGIPLPMPLPAGLVIHSPAARRLADLSRRLDAARPLPEGRRRHSCIPPRSHPMAED